VFASPRPVDRTKLGRPWAPRPPGRGFPGRPREVASGTKKRRWWLRREGPPPGDAHPPSPSVCVCLGTGPWGLWWSEGGGGGGLLARARRPRGRPRELRGPVRGPHAQRCVTVTPSGEVAAAGTVLPPSAPPESEVLSPAQLPPLPLYPLVPTL
jgi:hypothetical protein